MNVCYVAVCHIPQVISNFCSFDSITPLGVVILTECAKTKIKKMLAKTKQPLGWITTTNERKSKTRLRLNATPATYPLGMRIFSHIFLAFSKGKQRVYEKCLPQLSLICFAKSYLFYFFNFSAPLKWAGAYACRNIMAHPQIMRCCYSIAFPASPRPLILFSSHRSCPVGFFNFMLALISTFQNKSCCCCCCRYHHHTFLAYSTLLLSTLCSNFNALLQLLCCSPSRLAAHLTCWLSLPDRALVVYACVCLEHL